MPTFTTLPVPSQPTYALKYTNLNSKVFTTSDKMRFGYLLLALPYLCLAAPISDYASIDARGGGCARGVDSADCGGHQAYKREELDARGGGCARGVDSADCGGHQAYKREELDARGGGCARGVDSADCGGHQAY
ncbi:hypothetical protein PENCOP_c004G04223 [Penicillium coprophilum]|uniref:Uncharacterized protein n=1 Tax=Penicillium coprophilum TaxID=36646 RepID=A0A1V6UVI4_9EURO|nr:hypothetical protein PENCOP_c004G04223 [Penicillium coprophilum]